METAGYSGTSLAKKLGIKDGFKIKIVNAPGYYLQLFSEFPRQTKMIQDDQTKADFVHFFCTNAEDLNTNIGALKKQLQPAGIIWVSWYKKSAKIATDVTEEMIRHVAIQNGLVDIKVCAVDEKWSGLKLVIPVKDRALSK